MRRALALLALGGGLAGCGGFDRDYLAMELLNLEGTPSSLELIGCWSQPVLTDYLVTCEVRIEPAEFPVLLSGYEYEELIFVSSIDSINWAEVPDGRTVTDVKFSNEIPYPGLLPDRDAFPVMFGYITHPFERTVFPDGSILLGGDISIYASHDRSRVIIDIYEE